MKKKIIAALVLFVLAGLPVAPPTLRAQDGLTPEQQAAVEDVRAAFDNFVALDSFAASMTTGLDQTITLAFQGDLVLITQEVTSEGMLLTQKAPDNLNDNQYVNLQQMTNTTMTGAGLDDQAALGPMTTEVIVFDDRFYLRMEMPPDMAGLVPQGWHDITESADAFPGLSLIDVKQLVSLGALLGPEDLYTLLEGVVDVEILEPAATGELGDPVNVYRLALNPRIVLDLLSGQAFGDLFDSDALPFDASKLYEAIYSDEHTLMWIRVAVGVEDQALYEYTVYLDFDVDLGSDVFTDASLQGAKLSMAQTTTQSFMLHTLHEPIDIQAPELAD